MNRNVIVILCMVVAITALLLVGKRASKPPDTVNTAANGQATPEPAQGAGDPAKGTVAPVFELKSIPDGKATPLASFHGKGRAAEFLGHMVRSLQD